MVAAASHAQDKGATVVFNADSWSSDGISDELLAKVDIFSPTFEVLNKLVDRAYVSKESKEDQKPQVFFAYGGPSSGKTVTGSRAAGKLGLTHVSVGDLIRSEIEKKTAIGELAEKFVT